MSIGVASTNARNADSMPGGGLKDLGADDSGLDETAPSRRNRRRPSNVKFRQPWEPLFNAKARGPAMADKPEGFQATAGDRVSRSMQSCSRMERVEILEGDFEKKLFR